MHRVVLRVVRIELGIVVFLGPVLSFDLHAVELRAKILLRVRVLDCFIQLYTLPFLGVLANAEGVR